MPRPLRVEYPGAIYHLMSRGDHREDIFRDDTDRRTFLATLTEACRKTEWQVHAYCLMNNHFHLIAETPQGNLVAGMKWLLATYPGRYNRRHKLFGHLFSGRYKSLVIDERGGDYLRTACDYVHLNPFRAGLIPPEEPLSAYAWSSYPSYLMPTRRPAWLRVDRLLGEHAIQADSAEGRIEFQRRLEDRRRENEPAEQWAVFRRGWKLGASDFAQRLAERLGRAGQAHEAARERQETDEQRAERLVQEWLIRSRWTEQDLMKAAKGDRRKAELAVQLREQTPMTRQWIGQKKLQKNVAWIVRHLQCFQNHLDIDENEKVFFLDGKNSVSFGLHIVIGVCSVIYRLVPRWNLFLDGGGTGGYPHRNRRAGARSEHARPNSDGSGTHAAIHR